MPNRKGNLARSVMLVVLAAGAVTLAGLQQSPRYEASALQHVAWDQFTLEYRGEPPTQEMNPLAHLLLPCTGRVGTRAQVGLSAGWLYDRDSRLGNRL